MPWLGGCSGALTLPAPCPEVLGPLHWEAQQCPHVQIPCVTHPRGWILGWGMCRAFLQGSRKGLDTSWGIKALSQGCALGKFNLLALKTSHFPLVMRMLSWVGSPASFPEKEPRLEQQHILLHTSSFHTGTDQHTGQHKDFIVPRWK